MQHLQKTGGGVPNWQSLPLALQDRCVGHLAVGLVAEYILNRRLESIILLGT